jgi:hypothetical protein
MTKTGNPNTTCTLQLCKNKQESGEDMFKAAVVEAVEESFASFRNLDKQTVYFHLENGFKLKKEEIPNQIEDFADAIERMFGVGAKLIEIRIIQALHKRIRDFMFVPKKGDVMFKEYTTSLRAFLRQTLG